MTLVRANALGWAAFEELTATQCNTMDSQLPYALDGGAGGVYGPSADLEIDNVNTGALRLKGATHWLKLETREVLIPQGLRPVFISDKSVGNPYQTLFSDGSGADWKAATATALNKGAFQQSYVDATGTAITPEIWFEMSRYPLLALLKGARIDIYHPTVGADPTVRPKADVWMLDNSPGNVPTLQQIGAPVTVAANYRTSNPTVTKSIEVDFNDFAPVEGRRLFIALYGEANTGAAGGLRALQIYLKTDISQIRV